MTEMENESEVAKKYTCETGHEFKETKDDYELIEWLLKEILGLKQELTTIRSRTEWHYPPEVPEISKRYVVAYSTWGGTNIDSCLFDAVYNEWCASYVINRWAYLPTDKE
jgi:hypothetical protein